MKKIKKNIILFFLVTLLIIVLSNLYINHFSSHFLFDNSENLPVNEFGLILGTNKYLLKGGLNKYFEQRTQTASILYTAKKIKKIVISGYAESRYYNEPLQLKKELLINGIPDSVIILDMQGYRTSMSINNLLKLNTTDTITIISQKFHNQRAVFWANKTGINAIGFNIPDTVSKNNFKTYIRETFAKTLAFLEIIFNSHK